MSTALIGENRGRRSDWGPHEKIAIQRSVKEELITLLFQPWMRGVGYSEFIERAIKRAYEEADEQG